ncbi:hypothetical protein CQW23_03429 [Capsicum baccatum]|uniref:Glabrous enhancer-binding protein-like DBD domain-containing protein n=1 Tax=Capsicum baccatum TaxID=33114 RepID=A0A2G2XBT7_CAPBA|nr:hypothetical protein CQW23_03429 [Capsicum baccatum]
MSLANSQTNSSEKLIMKSSNVKMSGFQRDMKKNLQTNQQQPVKNSKDMPTINWACLYNGTPDGLKEGFGDDVNDDEEVRPRDDVNVNDDDEGKKDNDEESKGGTTKSKDEQDNDIGSSDEVQESTSKAITHVKDDDALVKTQSKPFQRVWTDKDEKILLEAIGSYRAIHGKEPTSNNLFSIIKGKISFEPTLVQVCNKIRSLKRIKRKPRQRIVEDTPAEKSLFCSSEKVLGVNKMCSTTAQSSKGKKVLNDAEVARIVMTLFQGYEGDEVMQIETSTRKVSQLIASGLSTKWKDLIKAQANQYLIGLNNRKSKVELFLEMMEVEAREHDDNDTE